MLGTSSLIGSSGDGGGGGGGSAHESEGGPGEGVVRPSPEASIMATGMEDEEKTQSGSGIGIGGGGSGDLFENDRSTGGNRWPRQETIALLKIRSDMDVIFRDSSLKGPLWEEVSRKMAELGYHRSAKKCKEKFENVYKYHKRTKDGRTGKADGKTYRFFEQLEALEQHHLSMTTSSALPPLPQPVGQATTPQQQRGQSQGPAQAAVPVTMVIPAGTNPASVTVPSSPHPISVVHTTCISPLPHHQQQQQMNVNNPTNQASQLQPQQQPQPQVIHHQSQNQNQHQHQQQHQQTMGIPTHGSIQMENPSSPSATQSSSSSTSSDEELMGRRKRKRKWKDFFEKLMKEVIDKQEELQKRFLEAVEKREHDRVAREEAWKLQEMARLNREHDFLVQERSMAAAKDAALISFLQKLSDQQQIPLPLPVQSQTQPQAQTQPQGGQVRATVPVVSPTPVSQPQPQPQPQPTQQVLQQTQSQPQPQPQPQVHVPESQVSLASPTQPRPQTQTIAQLPQQPPPQLQQALVVANTNNGGDNSDFQKSSNGENLLQASSSRWPKAEVQALINLRTNLDQKYQENGPKGPLWEEISAAMRKLGYNRNAKRCKEKWENINKYFKKVKESNKKRPEDSKTCPYFHQLDALYRGRSKMEINPATTNATPLTTYGQAQQQPATTMAPIMAQPEQQWPLQSHQDQAMEDQGSENQDESEDDMDDEDDDDQGSGGYEIVANNNVNAGSMTTSTTATRTAATAE
ncbi:trihelix transcription factor GT-2-like [Chenopodium quinoa]|uniref:trihelix transcription factor GT-2-like n=1 Tax=Chenopodium quinoa TaxID=63459 RepID=UPI000B781949|nr:trihelix transcription factor GT-2-like [Chenopodium quinoa]